MKHATRVPCLLELPAGRAVKIGDLPRMMANAMHDGDRPETAADRAAAEVNIRAKLDEMGANDMSETLDPLTLDEQARLNADALRRRGVHSDRPGNLWNLGEWLAQLGIELRLIESLAGPRYWTISNAAKSIATQQGLDEPATDALLRKMMEAACAGELEVLDPHRNQPCRVGSPRDWYYRTTTLSTVNDWLLKVEADYRWGYATGFPDLDEPGALVQNQLRPVARGGSGNSGK